MTWQFQNDRPIYTQLLEQIRIRIISGEYPAGSKLPSVRELAEEASVNPNTMQKALAELELSSLIYSQRTTGRFVTEDINQVLSSKEALAKEKILIFLRQMRELGLSVEETCRLIEKEAKELT